MFGKCQWCLCGFCPSKPLAALIELLNQFKFYDFEGNELLIEVNSGISPRTTRGIYKMEKWLCGATHRTGARRDVNDFGFGYASQARNIHIKLEYLL